MSEMISISEAARRAGKSDGTIRNWVRSGFLTAVIPPSGNGVTVSADELEAMMKPVPAARRDMKRDA